MFGRFRRGDEVVGFAFSGGGSRGAAQSGALRALTEAGIEPQLVAGTSVGAVNAAWFALHPERVDQMEAIWLSLRTRDIFPGNGLRLLFNLTRRGYVHAADAWEGFLRRNLGDAKLEESTIPCSIVAVRLSDGNRVVFDQGSVVQAIMASTAIPGVFPPYRIGDELYVDGGILEYLPIPTLLERGADTIWALDCSSYGPMTSDPQAVADRCARISAYHSVRAMTALPEARGHSIHVLRPTLTEYGDGRDFRHTADLIEAGYLQARQYVRGETYPAVNQSTAIVPAR